MTIYPKTAVLAALRRALALAPDEDAAVRATAQAMGLPVATVREVLDEQATERQALKEAA